MTTVTLTSCDSIYDRLGLPDAAVLVDVRDDERYLARPVAIPGAVRGRPPDLASWSRTLPRTRPVVLYDLDGNAQGHSLAAALAATGMQVSMLDGGLERWLACGYATVRVRADLKVPGGSRWVTRR